jgi:chemotaxis protein MotB
MHRDRPWGTALVRAPASPPPGFRRIIMRTLPILFAGVILISGCVSHKKYDAAMDHVNKLRSDSLAYEDQVRGLQAQVYGLEGNVQLTASELEARKRELKQKDAELKEKAKRMDDLDRKLRMQIDAMSALHKKVSDALVNFNAEDLSVDMRDGKVYVSLSEKLLFPSGSAVVEPKGKQALGQLASVLNSSKDINVMIEGHTDTVPIHTARFKDNWDLSTARATSVARILTEDNSVDPTRITSSGRGEFIPVAANTDPVGRQRNRRTEIILVPKLDELYEVVGVTEPKEE